MNISRLQLAARRTVRENVLYLVVTEMFVLFSGLRALHGAVVLSIGRFRFLSYAILVPAGCFAILLIIELFQDASDAKRERAGILIFRGKVGLRVFLFVALTVAFAQDVGTFRQDGHLQIWDLVSTGEVALLAFCCWPRAIEFSNGAISERDLFGGMTSISFSDVTGATFYAQQQWIVVSGKSRSKIIHTPLHADRTQFARQLLLLTGTQVSGLTS